MVQRDGAGPPSMSTPVFEHVRYVTDSEASPSAVAEFLREVLTDPVSAAVLVGGAVSVCVTALAYLRLRPAPRDVAALRDALSAYERFVPWMLRLSLGLPLVGAGFAGYFFTPEVPVTLRLFQVSVGFLLLFGLTTRAVAFLGLLAYLTGLATDLDLLLAGEFAGGLVAVVLLGAGRPSADHLLQRVADAPGTLYGRVDPVHRLATRFDRAVAPYERYAPVAVRASLGVTFAYLGLWEKLAHPGRSLAVVAKYDLTALVPVSPELWVVGAALVELGVGVLLLVGLFTRATAAVAFLTLTMTLFGLADDPVLAHVSLFGLSSVLFVTGSGPLSLDAALNDDTSRSASVEHVA